MANEIQKINFGELLNKEGIDRVENNSDSYIKRARVYFSNGEQLSIIRGHGTYGSEQGLFEIMADSRHYDDYDPECDSANDVRGYLTPDQVMYYIDKIASKKL